MNTSTKTRGVGRPRSTQKHDAILSAARELFLSAGFSNTSMENVAEAAGVGKPTVYNHFGSKEELFAAVIAVREQKLMTDLGGVGTPTENPRDDLLRFAVRFHEVILTPNARRWDRLVIAEAERHPELAKTLFKAGPMKVVNMLQTYIAAQCEAGRLDAADSSLAAEHLLGLLLGLELLRGQVASQPRRTKAQRQARAAAAVDVFLASYSPKRKGESS